MLVQPTFVGRDVEFRDPRFKILSYRYQIIYQACEYLLPIYRCTLTLSSHFTTHDTRMIY